MAEMMRKVRKYGSQRRHVEIGLHYYDYFSVGDVVVVMSKDDYDRLKDNK
jgi:hypothetical protein